MKLSFQLETEFLKVKNFCKKIRINSYFRCYSKIIVNPFNPKERQTHKHEEPPWLWLSSMLRILTNKPPVFWIFADLFASG
jgi:hypothetical protein